MLELIKTRDDVLALTASGRLTRDELVPLTERLSQALDRHDKVHVFVETQGLEGIEISDLSSYVADAIPMLGKLRRFGRVAVVADQAWVRAATRLESAVLPGISYRVFKPGERTAALDWVQRGEN